MGHHQSGYEVDTRQGSRVVPRIVQFEVSGDIHNLILILTMSNIDMSILGTTQY